MKVILIVAILFMSFSCKTDQAVVENNSDLKIENEDELLIENQCLQYIASGIEGKITFLEGDAMPGPDGPAAKPQPIQREVWICQPLKRLEVPSEEGVFFNIEPEMVVISKLSTKEGCYRISLKPGTYSVLVKEGDKGWFANLFDRHDLIQPVTIESGKISKMDIVINYKAAY
jgi:hypothetical protein